MRMTKPAKAGFFAGKGAAQGTKVNKSGQTRGLFVIAGFGELGE